MYKRFVNIIIIISFVGIMAVIAMPQVSEYIMRKAGLYENSYRWQRSDELYRISVTLDPYNAEVLGAYADFLLRKGLLYKNRTGLLDRSAVYFLEAHKYDKYGAEYLIGAAAAKLRKADIVKSRAGSNVTGSLVREGMGLLALADNNDPNGFNTAYRISDIGIRSWKFINKAQRDFIVRKAYYVLKITPWYGMEIYPILWEASGDFTQLLRVTPYTFDNLLCLKHFIHTWNLWQYRSAVDEMLNDIMSLRHREIFDAERKKRTDTVRKIKEKLLGSMSEAERDASSAVSETVFTADKWIDRNARDNREIIGGKMYWNGTIDNVVHPASGKNMIFIEMTKKVTIDTDDPESRLLDPYVVVRLDGDIIGEGFISNRKTMEHMFEIDTDGGWKLLSVEFVNSKLMRSKDIDRNVFIGNVRIVPETNTGEQDV